MLMKKYQSKTIVKTLPFNIQRIWEVVTTPELQVKWRKKVTSVKMLSSKEFEEVIEGGFVIKFKETKKEKFSQYNLEFDSKMFEGYWVGLFKKIGENETEVSFTENSYVKNPFLRFITKFSPYLNSFIQEYIEELNHHLELENKN